MSYLVLARKHRPQRFADLVGQEHVARALTNAIAGNRVHHAYLFTGARGVGKTSAARILAKSLSCEKGPTADPCGVCEACVEIAAGRSVDIVEIDGASNTGVDDVRVLREAVRYMPAKAPRKIYIIDEVHMLSTSAFNALLKTLEEPPPHVVFVFATTEVHKIPATILSRCQRYDFKLIPNARLVAHLVSVLQAEGVTFDDDGLRLVARQAAGSVRDALSLLDQVLAYGGPDGVSQRAAAEVLGVADGPLLRELARAVLGRDTATALRILARAVEGGLDVGQLAKSFLGVLRDLEIVRRVPDPGDLVDATADELGELKVVAALARDQDGLLPVLFERWARAVDESTQSLAPRLLFEMALVEMGSAEPLEPLGELVTRLEELESRLGQAGPVPARGEVRRAPAVAPHTASSPAPASAPAPAPSRAATTGAPRPPAAEALPAVLPAPEAATPDAAPPTVGEGWARVKSQFEQRRPSLGALLAHAHLLDGPMDDGRFLLGFADRNDADRAEKARGEIETALGAVFGRPLKLVATLDPAAAAAVRSEAGVAAEHTASDRLHREQEARRHPMVQKASDVFGVSIREIKTT